MERFASSLTVATAAAAALAFAVEAWAEEYVCRFDEAIRRVELRVADPQERLPCEVVYWKDTERPGRPEVLWHAQTDAEFCEIKTQELVERLESGGWSCRAADDARAVAADQEDAPDVALEAPDDGGIAAPAAGPDRDALEALLEEAIARDLARLSELTTQGGFDAQIAAFGDLDGDGIEDAAVIMTYTNGAARTQFLVAYVFQGGAYLPVAKAALTDPDEGVQGAEVEAIEGGRIRLKLELLEPGDPECCPSGSSRTAFVVQNGRLVEIPTS